MIKISFTPLETKVAVHYRKGGTDAYGRVPETQISQGGAPCRFCLHDIAPGEPMMLLAHRPFPADQPYAETGPIFIHRAACARYQDAAVLPPIFRVREEVVVRGYDRNDRMVYSTARRTPTSELEQTAAALMEHPDVAYLHVRGTVTTCFQCRIDPAT